MNRKTIPMRKCVGCGNSFPKETLVRLGVQDGALAIDESGRMQGRGAYLCRSIECVEKAFKKKNAFFSLKVFPQQEEKEKLGQGLVQVFAGGGR